MFVKDGDNLINLEDISRVIKEYEGTVIFHLKSSSSTYRSRLTWEQWHQLLNPLDPRKEDNERYI